MKKNLLKSMIALAAFCLGGISAYAQNQVGTGTVKMTYVSGSDADVDVAYGQCDTIKAGWNLGNAVAVGSTISFGNKAWGANWIGVLKLDVSAIPGTVQKATLKAKVSGSLDSKRNTGWGVAVTDNAWAADLTYTTVGTWTVSKLLNGGTQVWTSSRSAAGFEDASWDVTDAFSGGQTSATILVYEGIKDGNGGAAGGYMTEAEVEVEYEPYEATTTKYDFEDGTHPFTNFNRVSGAITSDDVLGSNVLVFTAANNCQNGYGFARYDFTSKLDQPAMVGIEFDYFNEAETRSILTLGDADVRWWTKEHDNWDYSVGNGAGFDKNTYGPKGAVFRIGSDKSNAFINDIIFPQVDVVTEAVLDEETGEEITPASTTYGLCNKWLHVSLMANIETRTIAWIVTDKEGNLIHQGSDAFWQDDANALSQIDIFAWLNNKMSGKVDNLKITNYKSNAVFADYTIQYVDSEGKEIKEARKGNGQVGKFVTLLDSDKATITADVEEGGIDGKMKYIYSSDDSETVAIADGGTAVITVTFRDADVYAAVLNCMINGQTGADGRLASFTGNFFEGDNYYVRPSRGYGKEGVYYFVEADSYNGKVFTFPGSVNSRTISGVTYYIGQLDYTAVDSVAYYAEFEYLALPVEDAGEGTGLGQLVGSVNSWWSFSGGVFDRFSGGRGIRLDADSYVYTEPIAEEGAYKVTIYGRNDVSAADANPYALGFIEKGSEEVKIYSGLTINSWGSATTGESVVEGVNIPAGAKLVIMNTNEDATSKISLDDISLTKTGEYQIPTGIKNVEKIQNAGVIYNLAGQKVSNNFKGIVVKDGRKMIQK